MVSIHHIDQYVGEFKAYQANGQLKEKGEQLIRRLVKEGILMKDDYMYLGDESITMYTFNVYDGVGADESRHYPGIMVIKRNEKGMKMLGNGVAYEVHIDDTDKTYHFKQIRG